MRGIRALTLVILVVFAALASGAVGERRDRMVRAPRPLLIAPSLPAPITIEAGSGSRSVDYRIGTDGRARRVPVVMGAFPKNASFASAPGVWWAVRHRRLVIGYRRRSVWRSHGQFPSVLYINMVQVGSRAVAFSYRNTTLYLAPLHGAERAVAPAEAPLGFTSGGLYTNQRGRRLLLRSDTGAILKTIVRRPLQWDYFVLDGSLYFIADGMLMRARGPVVRRVVSLRRLGLSARSVSMQPVGPLLELEDQRRLVFLRPDGSLFASTPLQGSAYRAENEGNVYAVVGASGVAFLVAPGQRTGRESVYLLRAGWGRAISVHRLRVSLAGCAHWVKLQWHGKWLLYDDVAGDLALIDTTGAHRVIELGGLVRRLPGAREGFSAYWSGQPMEP